MRKIPKAAQKAANYIRKTVKRPKKLPKPNHFPCPTHGSFSSLRWGLKCPLGMLKEAAWSEPTPTELRFFKTRPDELTNTNIKYFYEWWDDIDVSDAREAMNAVWGPET